MSQDTAQTGFFRPQNADQVVDWVDGVLEKAIEARASDIHFEPTARDMRIRLRLDGVLNDVLQLPKGLAENAVSRLKVLAGLLTYRNDIPQEGRLSFLSRQQGLTYDQRLSVFPTIHGQRAVVRIFYEERQLTQLSHLGLPNAICERLQVIASQNQGVLLLTGPAGSGKSTTLAAVLRDILDRFPGRSVITLEDPVERQIEGATQIQIPPHGELTFPKALRSLLRQDPEVLMLGEIRDAQTAQIAIESGLTGHLVMSTMHSGTPAGTLLRLLEMGIAPYQVTSSIAAVVNQRLVRRLCPQCKGYDGKHATAVGCEACMDTGYAGRVLLCELVELTAPLREAILQRADTSHIERLLQDKEHRSIAAHGQVLLSEGITSPDEIQRVCGVDPQQL